MSENSNELKPFKTGKVRDIYKFDSKLLITATDRISAFDFILPSMIPDKGKVLTQISLFWFEFFKDTIKNHLISAETGEFPEELSGFLSEFEQRSMLVKEAEVIPFECVARGYIEGSGWKDYGNTGSICGIRLPEGLRRGDKLPEPIFTPATKAEEGHDENVSFETMAESVGEEIAQKLKEYTLTLYTRAAEYAIGKGIIIADTKFEFGLFNDEIILIDEVLTPDSSRFWPVDEYKPGQAQKSFDKQFVRDYLESIEWDKKPPVPHLPDEIIQKTRAKYLEAYRLLTGREPDFI